MADAEALEQDGMKFALQAVACDERQEFHTAIFYYTEAAQALLSAALAGSKLANIVDRANDYISRAEELKKTGGRGETIVKTQIQLDLERGEYLLRQAFEEDESGASDEAVQSYSQATEIFLKIRKETQDVELQQKVAKLATQALDRAEALKGHKPTAHSPKRDVKVESGRPAQGGVRPRPLGDSLLEDPSRPRPPGGAGPGPGAGQQGGEAYTKDEIQVLRRSSTINGRDYVPFMLVDMRERFAYSVPFTDKHGMLALSPKQKSRFQGWVRPSDIMDNPQMILAVSSFSIKQTIVSDCSFVASLAISAQYERRFKRKLITSIIFPQSRDHQPQYNPCGKYMIKLNINGVPRKVIVDDYLPMGQGGELLCSFSNNRNELWVSLLEKAYLKVMGGYDFPGSNSNIDLHALTGWIPERVPIHPKHSPFNADKEFTKIKDRFHMGHCLVTVATGELTDQEGERAGLVPTHAYAMLDIRDVQGQKLLMLKNPWSHLRWRGNFSEKDEQSWTPQLQKALNYDPKSAQMVDNGVFWIDWKSLMRFFEVIYINWSPDLFSHTTCLHDTWSARAGPKRDVYDISDNPQYRLVVRAGTTSPVWVLLTRHITDKDDFADNKEFITLLVYKNEGRRVYYPYDPPPFMDGVRVNSPHYLAKIVQEPGTVSYSLVVSQYEKNNTIDYTLRVYSTCDIKLQKIVDPYVEKYMKRITSEWKGRSAGGCANNRETHQNNPIIQIHVDGNSTDNHLLLELRGPKEYSVGFDVVTVSETNSSAPGSFKKKSSGDFRRGFCYIQLDQISSGIYNVIPCTFSAGQEGHFILQVSSSSLIHLKQIQ